MLDRYIEVLGGTIRGNSARVKCPIHNTKTHAMKVTDVGKENPLFHCFGGCSFTEVMSELDALGLWNRDKNWKEKSLLESKSRKLEGRKHYLKVRELVRNWVYFTDGDYTDIEHQIDSAFTRMRRSFFYSKTLTDEDRIEVDDEYWEFKSLMDLDYEQRRTHGNEETVRERTKAA